MGDTGLLVGENLRPLSFLFFLNYHYPGFQPSWLFLLRWFIVHITFYLLRKVFQTIFPKFSF